MVKIDFKEDRQRKEWESGDVSIHLVKRIKFLCEYINIAYPDYGSLTMTDIIRTSDEQDRIYLTSPTLKEMYKKKPWLSVHQFGRGIDIRTTDMEKNMVNRILIVLNSIPYDVKRPSKKTAIFHNVGSGEHIHIQTVK